MNELQLQRRRAQIERRRKCAAIVILIGHGRPEGDVEEAAFVANRQLHQRAAVLLDHASGPADEGVQLFARVGIAVIVNAIKADKHRDRRPQLREKLAATGAQPRKHFRQQPLLERVRIERLRIQVPAFDFRRFRQGLDQRKAVRMSFLLSPLGDRQVLAESRDGGFIEEEIASIRQVLALDHPGDGAAGHGVNQLNRGIANQETPRRSRGDGDLHREFKHADAFDLQPGMFLHAALDARPRRGPAPAVVALEPAGDRIAGKTDHAAALPVYFAD